MSQSQSPNIANDYNEFVPFTARMMAAMRSLESARNDRLFDDPFAATLAGEEAFQRVEQQLTQQDKMYVAVRTRFFDDFLLSTSVRQVVILASGLDTRAYRLPWCSGMKLYELDFPEVLDYKESCLKNINFKCDRYGIPADLNQPWEDKLIAAGYCPEHPSIWLAEGLLMSLSEDRVHQILSTISRLSISGSYLGLDLINTHSLEYEPYRGYFQSGWDNPEELLSIYGWEAKVIQPGDDGANFDRLTESFPPRNVAGIQRVFLIRAVKK
ncbi:MAG: SAM-dependent methyltransferase [Geitlerinemataceae cyanobacterium]